MIIADDLALCAVPAIGNPRTVAVDVVERDVERFVDGRRADGLAGVHQVARRFGLAVNGDRLARERFKVDATTGAAIEDLDSFVDKAFAAQSRAGAGCVDELDGSRFEDAGANAAQHIFLGFLFEDHGLDAGLGE